MINKFMFIKYFLLNNWNYVIHRTGEMLLSVKNTIVEEVIIIGN